MAATTFLRTLLFLLGVHLISTTSASPVLEAGTEQEKIWHGTNADRSYPFLANLIATKPNIDFPFCGGSLIDSTHILTAAHCFDTMEDDIKKGWTIEIWLAATSIDPPKYEQKFQVTMANVLLHTNWNHTGKSEDDLAIITLPEPATFNDKVSPICLGDLDGYKDLDVTLIGFGNIDCKNNANELQIAIGKTTESDNCKPWHPKYMKNYHVCYVLKNVNTGGYTSQAKGDSGGPVFRTTDAGFQQIGVVSFGQKDDNGCPDATYPNVGSIPARFKDFIEKEANAKPTYCN